MRPARKKNRIKPTTIETTVPRVQSMPTSHTDNSDANDIAAATTAKIMMNAEKPRSAAKASHNATTTLAPSNPQKRDFTARYVARTVTGSLQSRWATKVRVAPPITMMLKSAPQIMITMPPSQRSTYSAMLRSLAVAVSSRQAIVLIVEPRAETSTGGAGILIRVRKWRRYRRTARSIRSPAPNGARERSLLSGFIRWE